MDVTYVYTVSDAGQMIPQVIRSIKSLNKYAKKEDIVVFFTPPTSKLSYARLSKIARVELRANQSKPFQFIKADIDKQGHTFGRYGEKCHLCDVSSSIVVFLDADTIVRKNLTPLLEGDFDFSARKHYPTKESELNSIDNEVYLGIFNKERKKPIPMPNTGFMIFKNHYHQKIKEQWLKYINDDKLPNPCLINNPKEQTALALALDEMRIRWLTEKEHAYWWLGEKKVDTYVQHKFFLLPSPRFEHFEIDAYVCSAMILRIVSNLFFGSKVRTGTHQ